MHRENKFCIGVFQHKINPECLIRSQPRIHRDKRKIDRLVRKLTDLVPESAFLFVGTIDEAVAKAKKGEHS